MNKTIKSVVDLVVVLAGVLSASFCLYRLYWSYQYTQIDGMLLWTNCTLLTGVIVEIYWKRIRTRLKSRAENGFVVDPNSPIHMLKVLMLGFCALFWLDIFVTKHAVMADYLMPSVATALYLLWLAISLKRKKRVGLLNSINKQYGTKFVMYSGDSIYVDPITSKVLIADGNYIRVEDSSFVLKYEGELKTDISKSGVATSYVNAVFGIDDSSHPIVKTRMTANDYQVLTMLLETMWEKTLQNNFNTNAQV